MTDIEARFRALYEKKYPHRNADSFHLTDCELVICAYYDAELAKRDKALDEFSLKLSKLISAGQHA